MQEIENREFVQGVNFDFIDSLKSNGTKCLLLSDDSCQQVCNSKTFACSAAAGKHRGLSIIYRKHNLFHQTKLGRDVEFQNTDIVLLNFLYGVMQVSTLSERLGIGSELVDSYRDAIYVPYGKLLIDQSGRTDDRLRYCTNTRSMPSKYYIPDRLKQSKLLDDEHTKPLYSPSGLLNFSQMQKNFSFSLVLKVFRFLCECIVSLLKGNMQNIHRHHVTYFQNEFRLLSLNKITWNQRRNALASERRLQLIKVINSLVINDLY